MRKLLFILLLCSCSTSEVLDAYGELTQYTVRYHIETDSAYIRYNVGSDITRDTLRGVFDTTFHTDGGWWIIFDVYGDSKAFVEVNGEKIDSCESNYFNVRHYLY